MIDKERLDSLRKEIKLILYDTLDLITLVEFDKRFRGSVKTPRPINIFTQVISYNSTVAMVLSLCRHIDENKESVSLVNFLNKSINLSSKPEESIFNLRQFCKEWNRFTTGVVNSSDDVSDQNKAAEIDWKEYISKDDYISIKAIKADIAKLMEVTQKPKVYRNKRFGHLDKNHYKHIDENPMIYRELYSAADSIKNIVDKYYRVLHLNPISGFLVDDFTTHAPISIIF